MSAGGLAAAATSSAAASPALAFTGAFAAVSLGATAASAIAVRLLDEQDAGADRRR